MTLRTSILLAAALSTASLSMNLPTAAAGPRDATGVDAGYAHSCAVSTCGEVKCWGRNDWGQANDRFPSIFIGPFYQPPFVQASVGMYHSCALDSHGELLCWGKNNYSQVAEPSGTFVDLDVGANHACAINTAGQIECWGANDQNQSAPPSGPFIDISAGRLHSCAITDDGEQVSCWGSDSHGQARSVQTSELAFNGGESFVEVAAGGYHTCARTDWNNLYCWGGDTYQAVSGGGLAYDIGNGIYRHSAGGIWTNASAGTYGTAAIWRDQASINDNEIIDWGWPFSSPSYSAPSNPPSAPIEVAAGYNHACYVDVAGDVTCYGSNANGKSTPDAFTGFCGLVPFEPPFEL